MALCLSYFSFLFVITKPVSAQPTPTSLPAYYSKITKTINNQAYLGGIVDFTVTITLGSPKKGVVIEDIFSGGGKIPDTDFVAGSAQFNGISITDPTLYANQLNRVHYLFKLGDLDSGTYTLTYKWRISPNLGCYSSPANEVHLNATTINGHLSTSTVRFPVKCVTPPTFPTCPHVDAPVKVYYPTGLHWIVGNSQLQEGSDVVYSLGSNNYVQCFCPTTGTNGIQTNWLFIQGVAHTVISNYLKQDWISVPSGASFDLSDQPYVAKNSSFTCSQ